MPARPSVTPPGLHSPLGVAAPGWVSRDRVGSGLSPAGRPLVCPSGTGHRGRRVRADQGGESLDREIQAAGTCPLLCAFPAASGGLGGRSRTWRSEPFGVGLGPGGPIGNKQGPASAKTPAVRPLSGLLVLGRKLLTTLYPTRSPDPAALSDQCCRTQPWAHLGRLRRGSVTRAEMAPCSQSGRRPGI